jgi:fructokinase
MTEQDMKKILCIGEALIDMICTDNGSPLSDGQHFLKKAGGAPTNVAAAIAALGGRVSLAAKAGIDPFGQHLVSVMQSFGVDTSWLFRDKQAFTTLAFVSLVANGERDFYFNRGADGQLSQQDLEGIDPDDFGIIHFGSATAFLPGPLQVTYKDLLQKALQKNVFISFDPNYRHLLFVDNTKTFIDQAWTFLETCHFFKVSDEEAMLVTGTATLNDAVTVLLQKTKAVFAITLGKKGTMLGLDGKISVIKSIPVKAVDSTGAGDAFVGAVLYQLSSYSVNEILNLPAERWNEIIFNGNKAGARTCEYMGAMEAFSHLSNDIFK